MSFGWSIGDILSGLKVVWDVWNAVADGPLSARREACQFFEEYSQIIHCLNDWEQKALSIQDDADLSEIHLQLLQQCTIFLERHMRLINPHTEASVQEGLPSWRRRIDLTKAKILVLSQQVQWPFERDEVARLRKKLQLYLQLATYKVSASTHSVLQDVRASQLSNAELLSSNLRLVSSHLDLVSLITLNLKRVTHPLESGNQVNQIDYPMARQFENALLPPQPLRAIEANPRQTYLPFQPRGQRQVEEARYAAVLPSAPYDQRAGPFDQNEIRGLISERLDNLSMRRVETIDTLSSTGSRENSSASVQTLLERLQTIRNQIGEAVGFPLGATSDNYLSPIIVDPQSALLDELGAWNQLEERIQYEILHPGLLKSQTPNTNQNSSTSAPIPIPSSRGSVSLSPTSSPGPGGMSSEGWFGSTQGSPDSQRGSWNMNKPLSHTRTASTSSSSSPESIRLGNTFPVRLQYQNNKLQAIIQAVSRFDDGEVQSITMMSQDSLFEIRHSLDRSTPSIFETSMKPFLDNRHVDKLHKFRIQFQGSHTLKFTKANTPGSEKLHVLPTYTFNNEKDFLEFQYLLLNKEVKLYADVELIRSVKDKEVQCRLATVRILLDPIFKTRSILYFRTTKDKQKPSFVEWCTDIFKEPKEPTPKCRTLTLESSNGKSLSFSKASLSRCSTQGSATTIGTLESTAAAYSRLQEKSTGKGIKGLVLEFYDPYDCHKFWKEFIVKEVQFTGLGLGVCTDSH